jgi:type IV pilus assembly protein PilV
MLNQSRRGAQRSGQQGMFLIEALVAILLFAVGILGMVGMSALATAAQSDAEYRTEAASVANQIAQQAWLNVDRVTGSTPALRAASLATTLATFKHQTGGTDCNFSGDVATNAVATAWVTTAALHLPGATTAMQRIDVNTDATGFNRMTITVCWKVPANPVPRQHTLVTYVN